MENFNETSQPIIKLGKGAKKHCFLVSSIYGSIATQQIDGIEPVNPMNKEPISKADINNIFRVRKQYIESTKFRDFKEEKNSEMIGEIIKNLVINFGTDRILEIKNLSPEEVLERYDNLLKEKRKHAALTLRVIWEFFNFSEDIRLVPLIPTVHTIAMRLLNRLENRIAIGTITNDEAVKISNITKLTRKEMQDRRAVLNKVDQVESVLTLLLWTRHSQNNF